jgi:hypothetical protein
VRAASIDGHGDGSNSLELTCRLIDCVPGRRLLRLETRAARIAACINGCPAGRRVICGASSGATLATAPVAIALERHSRDKHNRFDRWMAGPSAMLASQGLLLQRSSDPRKRAEAGREWGMRKGEDGRWLVNSAVRGERRKQPPPRLTFRHFISECKLFIIVTCINECPSFVSRLRPGLLAGSGSPRSSGAEPW